MSNNSLAFLSRLYMDHMKVVNYADRTVGHRESTLAQFSVWCEERGILKPSELIKPILARYHRHLHHSCGFFKRATRQNYLLYNPVSELELQGRKAPAQSHALLGESRTDPVPAQHPYRRRRRS